MKRWSLRARALTAALLPVTLVATVLTAVFLAERVGDLDVSHRQRALAHARQVAAAAEFPMFARNDAALQALVGNALREPDVQAVAILAPDGAPVARAGEAKESVALPPEGRARTLEHVGEATRLVVHPIAAEDLPDLGLDPASATAPERPRRLLGYVALELSREGLVQRGQALVIAGIVVTLVGLVLGGLLAFQLFSGVTAELGARKDEAERATRAKTRFLAVASHDLRQPVHALGLFVERLGQLRHDEATRPLVDSVEASVRSLQDLLDELLDMSRLDSGMVQPRLAPVALAEVWADLHRQFAPEAARARLELRMRPSALWVTSDAVLLKRTLCNLVSNALRYTERGGVLVAGRRRGGRVFLEVWDTGIGIPPDLHKEVFQEFVQIKGPRGGREPGLGLGLAIVERTAALLDHPLSLRSVPGRGSRFRLEVPMAEPGKPEGEIEGTQPAAHPFAGLRVLLIDDDSLAREAMARLLHSWGCVLTTAASGPEACTRVDPATDLVACDYRLPEGEDGIAVVRRLRSQLGRQVPAFLVTGDTDPEVLQAAGEAGLVLLYKPVRPARLRAVVQRLSRGLKP